MTYEEICKKRFNQAKCICEELNKFSFNHVVKRNNVPTQWSVENRIGIRNSHSEGCCSLCNDIDKEDCSCIDVREKNDTNTYNMKYICHGAHSLDFLRSIKKSDGGNLFDDVENKPDKWNYTPVLFLFENPSSEKEPWEESGFAEKKLTIYEQNEGKCPSADWHWIYGGYSEDYLEYPNCFVQKAYGGLVASIVKMFRLANAYVTDAVKCSMNCGKKFLSTNQYHAKALENCCVKILCKEAEILTTYSKRLTIFAFGDRAYALARKYLVSNKYTVIVKLPHPARTTLSDNDRKYLIVSKILKVMCNRGNGILGIKEFLDNEKIVAINESVERNINDNDLRFKISEIFKEKDIKVSSINIQPEKLYVKVIFNYKNKKYGFCYEGYKENSFWAWDYADKRYITQKETDLQCLYGLFKQCLGVDMKYNDNILEL